MIQGRVNRRPKGFGTQAPPLPRPPPEPKPDFPVSNFTPVGSRENNQDQDPAKGIIFDMDGYDNFVSMLDSRGKLAFRLLVKTRCAAVWDAFKNSKRCRIEDMCTFATTLLSCGEIYEVDHIPTEEETSASFKNKYCARDKPAVCRAMGLYLIPKLKPIDLSACKVGFEGMHSGVSKDLEKSICDFAFGIYQNKRPDESGIKEIASMCFDVYMLMNLFQDKPPDFIKNSKMNHKTVMCDYMVHVFCNRSDTRELRKRWRNQMRNKNFKPRVEFHMFSLIRAFQFPGTIGYDIPDDVVERTGVCGVTECIFAHASQSVSSTARTMLFEISESGEYNQVVRASDRY